LSAFYISQGLATIAFIFGILAFQYKNRKFILRVWFLSALTNSLHFSILSEYEASLFVFITALRFLISSFSTNKQWIYIFLILSFLNLVINYESPVIILSFIATVLGTIGSFNNNVTIVRTYMGLVSIIWWWLVS